ncbi:MAG: DUF3999 family protein [Carboxydocellales bacterium]
MSKKAALLLTMLMVITGSQFTWLSPVSAEYQAQNWAYRKQIITHNSAKYYGQVKLDGETYNHLATSNFADLRVVADNQAGGGEVPYYLFSNQAIIEEKSYPATMLNNSLLAGEYSSFVLDLGAANRPNNRLNIETPGSKFLRRVEVEGTDNLKAAWNKLSTDDHIFDFQGNRSTQVHYGQNNFRYLRIKIINKGEPPLEITGAEVYYTLTQPKEELKLAAQLIYTQQDSNDKQSNQVTFDLGNANFPSHRLVLSVADQNFSRQLSLASSNDQKNWQESGEHTIYSYKIDNQVGQNLNLEYPEMFARYIRLTIHNQDNSPLNIQDSTCYSFPRHLVFPYNSGKQYALYYGNPKAKQPSYDIQQLATYFEKGNLPIFALGQEANNPQFLPEQKPWTEENKWILWSVLGLVVVVLGLTILRTITKVSAE